MTRGGAEYRRVLHSLASLWGVQTSFVDAMGVRRGASEESLARVCATLGSPAGSLVEARRSVKERQAELDRRRLEPVVVAWEGEASHASVRLEARQASAGVACSVHLESGEARHWMADARSMRSASKAGSRGALRTARLALPRDLPTGVHRLTVALRGATHESMLVCAPARSFQPSPERRQSGAWGLFCPVYALRSERNLGCGDLTDLRDLAAWSARAGGALVSTLPVLSASLDEPFEPSPYAPVSRLFWNELFVDPARTHEFARCAEARRLMASAEFQSEAAALRALPLVNYRRSGALHRRVMELLAREFFAGAGEKTPEYAAFLRENPLALEYARFRAVTEAQQVQWPRWTGDVATRPVREGDADEGVVRYHLYAQYASSRQIAECSREVRSRGGSLYLDLPVGVSAMGFDVYRYRQQFAMGCSTGAPPDPYFTGGQNWGFPPLHPERCREDGYGYVLSTLRHHMRRADVLRLDHVMAFYRLFWIPDGMDASGGVYVRYRAEEFFALLCLESVRHGCRLVGENLGTVPAEVNALMKDRALAELYVGQYEMQPKARSALRAVPAASVASVNTHDMPPLATTWAGTDVAERIELNLLDPSRRQAEEAARTKLKAALASFLGDRGLLRSRKPEAGEVRDALLEFLASSPAEFVLVNIEDLWLETLWQNVPGTMQEHPNWRRKLRYTLDEITRDPRLARSLERIGALRRGGATPASSEQSGVEQRTALQGA